MGRQRSECFTQAVKFTNKSGLTYWGGRGVDAPKVSTRSPGWTLALIPSAYSRTTDPFVGTAFGVRNDGPPGPWARRTLGGRASFYVTTWTSVWMAAILPQGLVRFHAIMYVVFVLRVLRLPITVVMLQPW